MEMVTLGRVTNGVGHAGPSEQLSWSLAAECLIELVTRGRVNSGIVHSGQSEQLNAWLRA